MNSSKKFYEVERVITKRNVCGKVRYNIVNEDIKPVDRFFNTSLNKTSQDLSCGKSMLLGLQFSLFIGRIT